MNTYNTTQWAKAFGSLGAVATLICTFWGKFLSDPGLVQMHTDMLRMSFFGYNGMDAMSIILAVLQGAIWSAIVGWLIAATLNKFAAK